MKKTFYISIISILVLLFSCNKSGTYKELNDFLRTTITESDSIAHIDLTKYHSDLIQHVEKQLKFDLCEKTYFTGQIMDKSNEILFPSFLTKECEHWTSSHNVITILLNKENQTLIDDKIISSKVNIRNKITEVSKEWIEYDKTPIRILYLFSWDNKTNPKKLKERTIQVLYGIKDFYDLIANKTFDKEYNRLSSSELEKFNSDYKFKIGYSGFEVIIPPPPPSNREQTKNK